jgi:hypothetical protein
MLAYDLGGVADPNRDDVITVNLVQPCDIQHDIIDVDAYCEDDSVSWFILHHTLEHIPSQYYVKFLCDLYRKLLPGGCVEVKQTDIGKLLKMVAAGDISLRSARMPIFSPPDRLRENPFHLHYSLWSEDMMRQDFVKLGYDPVQTYDAGSWAFDQRDELFPGDSELDQGVAIPNLGIRAYKEFDGRDAME